MKKIIEIIKWLFTENENNGTCEESMFGFDLFTKEKI